MTQTPSHHPFDARPYRQSFPARRLARAASADVSDRLYRKERARTSDDR